MKKRILFLFSGVFLIVLMASSPVLQQKSISSDQDFKNVVRKTSENGWVYFKENFKPDPKKFFSRYMKEFSLSGDDEMRLIKEEADSIFTFYRFQHYYKGVLVEGSSMSLQFKESNIELAFGTLAKELNFDIKNTIDPSYALEVAKKNSSSKLFAWESEEWESNIKKELNDNNATFLPKPELIITMSKDKKYKLTYKFPILTIEPKFDKSNYYIDALSGEFVKKVQRLINATSTGKVYYYTEDKQFTTYFVHQFPKGHWRLQDQTRGTITAKLTQGLPGIYYDWDNTDYLKDWNNYWDSESEKPAVSALWAAEKCYDHFAYRGWHGTDGNNRELRLHALFPAFNSGWGNSVYYEGQTWDDIVVGFYDNISWAALDVIGHEYTHGVSTYSANFDYVADESGALSEGFSDIFGEIIEYYVDGINDWHFAGDFGTLRSLDNPHESHIYYGQEIGHLPEYRYENGFWYFGTNVNTYTHTNCGVPDYWFYLLAVGDSQKGVSGIGMSAAANIAYRTLVTYLYNTPNATFAQAREASINAAIFCYNECSFQHQQVMNAWAAVHVGDPAPVPCVSPLVAPLYGPSSCYCWNLEYWYTVPAGGNGSYSYEWYFNGNLVSTSEDFWHSFTEFETGFNLVEMTVTSGEETVNEFLYVWVDCYIKGNTESEFSLFLYPNPASEITTLEIFENNNSKIKLEDKGCSVYLIDNNGRTMYNVKSKNKKIDINVSNLQEGTYHVVVIIGEYKSSINLNIVR